MSVTEQARRARVAAEALAVATRTTKDATLHAMADALVARMRQNHYGRDACIIGEVKAEPRGIVAMTTGFGGTRIVDMLVGEQLPRIC